MHEWHEEAGAVFEPVGQWLRPWYFPRPGEDMHAAVARECRATREGVGLFDASTLGKIDIQGPDAAVFLDRIYTNDWSDLAIGRCRYGLMLGEDGMVMDDGVTARLGEHHFLMSTTTGGAAHVLGWLEQWRQTEWPELRVRFTSVTDQWATIGVAGPTEPRPRRVALRGGRPRAGVVPVHAVPGRGVRGGAVPRLPHQLHRRAELRDQRAGRLRALRVGPHRRAPRGVLDHPLRHRDDARAAGGEGLHRGRPGDGRIGDPGRSRDGMDPVEEEGLPGPAVPRAERLPADRPPPARRARDHRPERGPPGGGPSSWRSRSPSSPRRWWGT